MHAAIEFDTDRSIIPWTWFGATRWSIPRGMEAGPLNLVIVELRGCFLVVRNWCQLTHVELVTRVTHFFGDNIRHRNNIDVQPVAWDCVWSCTVPTFSIVIVWLALHGACHANVSSGHLAIWPFATHGIRTGLLRSHGGLICKHYPATRKIPERLLLSSFWSFAPFRKAWCFVETDVPRVIEHQCGDRINMDQCKVDLIDTAEMPKGTSLTKKTIWRLSVSI